MISKPKPKIYVTAGDLTSCPRGVFYKKKKTPLPLVHPKIAEIWQLFGRLQEQGQRIQRALTLEWQEKQVLVSPERFIPWNEFGITGKYDAIIKEENRFILYEIKGGGKTIFENSLDTPEPYEEHRKQVIIYHYFLKSRFPSLSAKILYVERGGERRLEIPINYSEEEFFQLARSAKDLIDAIVNDQPPKPAETIVWNKFLGRYDINMAAITCKWHALCLGNDHWYEEAQSKLTILNKDEKIKKRG